MIYGKLLKFDYFIDKEALIDFSEFPDCASHGVRSFGFPESYGWETKRDFYETWYWMVARRPNPTYIAFEFDFRPDGKPIITDIVGFFTCMENLQRFRSQRLHLFTKESA